jgi:hypothetical protein
MQVLSVEDAASARVFVSTNVDEARTQQGRTSSKSVHEIKFENSISPDLRCAAQVARGTSGVRPCKLIPCSAR